MGSDAFTHNSQTATRNLFWGHVATFEVMSESIEFFRGEARGFWVNRHWRRGRVSEIEDRSMKGRYLSVSLESALLNSWDLSE